ncbi:hypothetical protein BDW74DRAFT_188992 [Aspergillus multicolor]|uniref:uncharacterized protein n=1 Tax=Aspergillus multicolor TaxID=41759 RepID=UPI003CCCFF60
MPKALSPPTAKPTFDTSTAYAPQEETSFFDDGREIDLLHFIYSHPDLESIRGSPQRVLDAIDEYARTKKYLMNVGEAKGRIVSDLIQEVKPEVMVELGGYVGYSCILFGAAVRACGGSRYFSLEMNPEFAAVIMALVELAGLADIVKVVVGPSDASLARLYTNGVLTHIDLMFLDHYKPAYTTDLKLCEELKLITPGSVLAADNVIKPGNPPYLEYVRASVEEKKRKLRDAGGGLANGGSMPGKAVDQYKDKSGFGAMKLNQSVGNPGLVYESRLVESFEPTGVPLVRSSHSCSCRALPTGDKMGEPLFHKHKLKNILLIALSLFILPITGTLTIATLLWSYVSGSPTRQGSSNAPGTKTILVTGVSMTKGLAIARILAKNTPHRIIGADTEPIPLTCPGRYSRSLNKFYKLESPNPNDAKPYINSLLSVIRKEGVHLWISCSSVVGALEDGEVMATARREFGQHFHAVQFDSETVRKFHEKDAFVEYIAGLGLAVPESHRCTSIAEVERIFDKTDEKKRFIMKPIGVNDKARGAMMTLLPLKAGRKNTSGYLRTLGISPSIPFILQQYIQGDEYCTHSLVVRGSVKAFVACPSSDMLMHYTALPPDSALSVKMLEFTKRVAEDGGDHFTGHLSFDFLVDGDGTDATLYPIECNPRAHTAVVLFQDTPAMADAYLSCFNNQKAQSGYNREVLVPKNPRYNYYWLGHDLVTLFIMPLLIWLFGRMGGPLCEIMPNLCMFRHHLLYWRDGTWVPWDPLPFFVLYHVYWPARLVECLINRREWSRVNVSTTKMFER